MHYKLIFMTLWFFIASVQPSAAKDLDDGSIRALFDQYAAVINSRDPKKIKQFLTYYADPDAKFYQNKIIINAATKKQEENMSKMDRDQYIKYITHIAADPIAYSFVLELHEIQINPDKLSATVSMHINELAIVSSNQPATTPAPGQNSISPAQKQKLKTVVSTNCNFALAMAGTNPVLTSGNCIEKLIYG